MGVDEVRWAKGDMVRAGDYISFCGKENESHQLRTVSSHAPNENKSDDTNESFL